MLHPMLCEKGNMNMLKMSGWEFEWKLDGTRILPIRTGNDFIIQSRPRKSGSTYTCSDYTRRLPEITQELKDIDETFILDGEGCVFNNKGVSEFTGSQRRCSTQNLGKIIRLRHQLPLTFCVFDILELNGEDLTHLRYGARKNILEDWLEEHNFSSVKFVESYTNGISLMNQVAELGGEGVIAKRADSKYHFKTRSHDWLKIRPWQKAICDVVGYTEGQNSRGETFGALVLAQNGQYVGKAGGGFKNNELIQVNRIIKKAPTIPKPFSIEEPYRAIKTRLRVEVKYFQQTENGVFRFPSFVRVVAESTLFGVKTWQKKLNMNRC